MPVDSDYRLGAFRVARVASSSACCDMLASGSTIGDHFGRLMSAGHEVADRSVRVAWADDAVAIGSIQARAWRETYAPVLPPELLDQIDAEAFGEQWRAAIVAPPTAKHRVLVALERNVVSGFAATAPSDDPDAQPGDGEIVAFHIDPGAFRAGHGSRLLAAAADTLRADGFTQARFWVVVPDDALRAFLEPAGWAPDGAHRELDLTGDGTARLRQVRLHTDLS